MNLCRYNEFESVRPYIVFCGYIMSLCPFIWHVVLAILASREIKFINLYYFEKGDTFIASLCG